MHPGLDVMDDPIGDVGGLAGALRRDTRLALPSDLLVKMDRAAMDSALEVRTAVLDRSGPRRRLVVARWTKNTAHQGGGQADAASVVEIEASGDQL